MRFRLTLLGLALCLTACSGQPAAPSPEGPHAQHLADLFWIFTAVCSAIWLIVMIVLLIGVSRGAPARIDPLQFDRGRERRHFFVVSGAVAGTLLTVIALTALSFLSQRNLFAHDKPAITI